MKEYVTPEFEKEAFNCPHCDAFAQQNWKPWLEQYSAKQYFSYGISKAECQACKDVSLWYKKKMVYPSLSTAPLPHPDIPEIIKADYNEARAILNHSPRGACALLRLVIQKLCDELVEGNQNLNQKIAELVKKGLPSQLQRAFDFVRITGNDAVHGLGEINIEDNPEIAQALFALINMIIEKMITEPVQVNELYNLIPENKRIAIEERDFK